MRPPPLSVSYGSLPTDLSERHEALVNVFGELAVWARNVALARAETLVESPDARSELGSIHQQPYDAVGSGDEHSRKAALDLAEATVDNFAKLILTCISGRGLDNAMGENHVAWFKLDLEIRKRNTEELVHTETINRDGKRFFAEYWHRWLNRFGRRAP